MNTEEKFKIWLTTIYSSENKKGSFKTPNHYAAGIRALNKIFNLPGEGIFDPNTDLQHIRNLINKNENFKTNYLTHFNAFVKFRHYCTEQEGKERKLLQRQINVLMKQQVEAAAIETTIKYFENRGYIVISKEQDNIGWDLEATNSNETLLLEVKGLSGAIVSIELTPNEYRNSVVKKSSYELCIVTNALTEPKLETFSFDTNSGCWKNKLNERLNIEERIAARMWK